MGLLRLLLAISVLIAHSTPIFGITLVGGRTAVESFFMLSGFAIALTFSHKYQNNLSNFYKNRFLKLFPLYWFFTIAVIITSLITTGKFTIFKDFFVTPFSKLILILFNISPLFSDVTNFMALNINNGQLFFTSSFRDTIPEIWNYLILPQGWTIGLEITFYFFAPLLIKQKTKTLILISAFSLLARLLAYQFLGLGHDPWEYRFFPFEIVFFIAGIIIYRHYQNPFWQKIYFAIPVFIATIFFKYIPNMIIYYLFVLISIPYLFNKFKDNKFDRLLGEISYPLYLCHFLIVDIFAQVIKVNHQYLGLYSLLLSLPISIISYYLIQKPIQKYRF